ncbi:MAG: hypothetical protein ACR2NA_04445 [Solirubrobacterales bacterium]
MRVGLSIEEWSWSRFAAALAVVFLLGSAQGAAQSMAANATLLSEGRSGEPGNGSSANASISQDRRKNRVIAFDSEASNLVPGDANHRRDVFFIKRAGSYGSNGTPWRPGSVRLASRGRGGKPANGDSWGASVGGVANRAPKCLAFVSKASNLVRNDTNGTADAFVYWFATKRIQRVSVDSRGRQARGSTFDVSVDGDCTKVAFTSSARNLALSNGGKRAWSKATSRTPRRRTRQTYLHFIKPAMGSERAFRGLTMVISRKGTRPGNGRSVGVSVSAMTGGRSVAFATTSSNLVRGDKNKAPDVFLFRWKPRWVGGTPTLSWSVKAVSRISGGTIGNGASTAPQIAPFAETVTYQSTASNLAGGGSQQKALRTEMRSKPRHKHVGKWPSGPTGSPTITGSASWVFFEAVSEAGVPETWLWYENRPQRPRQIGVPAASPTTSTHGNYVLVESPRDPYTRLRAGQGITPAELEAPRQIFLIYMGPK